MNRLDPKRLATLRELQVLDSLPDPRHEALVGSPAEILDVHFDTHLDPIVAKDTSGDPHLPRATGQIVDQPVAPGGACA